MYNRIVDHGAYPISLVKYFPNVVSLIRNNPNNVLSLDPRILASDLILNSL